MSAMVPALNSLVTLSSNGDQMVATLADSILVLVKHIEELERQLGEERARSRQMQMRQAEPQRPYGVSPAAYGAATGPTFLKRRVAHPVT